MSKQKKTVSKAKPTPKTSSSQAADLNPITDVADILFGWVFDGPTSTNHPDVKKADDNDDDDEGDEGEDAQDSERHSSNGNVTINFAGLFEGKRKPKRTQSAPTAGTDEKGKGKTQGKQNEEEDDDDVSGGD